MDTLFEFVMLVVVVTVVYGMVLWAHKGASDRSAYVGLYLLYGIPGVLLTIAGLALTVNNQDNGWFVLELGLALTLPLVKGVRQVVASVTPLDPDSTVDMMGLGLILALMAYFGWAITVETGSDVTTPAVTIPSQVINVVFFILVAYVAVGTNIYRSPREATSRLGLRWPTLRDIAVGVAAVIPAFMLSMVGSLLTYYFQPDLFDNLGSTMEEMSAGTHLVLINVLLFASAGLGEEILFRGAIQPRYGIVLAAAFWALVHTQYQFSYVVLGLFMVGVLFGLMRRHVSTTSAIIAHALYNAAVVLLQAYT